MLSGETPQSTAVATLIQRLECAKALYEDARRLRDLAALGAGNSKDVCIRRATCILNSFQHVYRRALKDFSDVILRGEAPPAHREDVVDLLNAAIATAGAEMGNIQILDPSVGLKIVAHVGFQQPFLQFFQCVHGGQAACGSALNAAQRVIVEDVERSPLFSVTARGVMIEAGALAVQSTPILTPGGAILGILSTHYRSPAPLKNRDFSGIDRIVKLLGYGQIPQLPGDESSD